MAERPPFEWCDSEGYSDYSSVTGGGHCSSKLAPLIDKQFALCSVGGEPLNTKHYKPILSRILKIGNAMETNEKDK